MCIHFNRKVFKYAYLSLSVYLSVCEVIKIESHSKYPESTFALCTTTIDQFYCKRKKKAIQMSVCTLSILSFAMVYLLVSFCVIHSDRFCSACPFPLNVVYKVRFYCIFIQVTRTTCDYYFNIKRKKKHGSMAAFNYDYYKNHANHGFEM